MYEILVGDLGLKAVAWDYSKNMFTSPQQSSFTWDRDGFAAGKCAGGSRLGVSRLPCQVIPGDDCMCGMYATFRVGIVTGYYNQSEITALLLVEASGLTISYTDGYRSKEQLVRASVDMTGVLSNKPTIKASTAQAADHFNVPVLKLPAALIAMDMWNTWLYDWYKPETREVSHIPRDELVKDFENRLGLRSEQWDQYNVKE
jgi:hypothetical protein